MDQILHIIGFCPDGLNHIDLSDFIVLYYNEIQTVYYTLLRYFKL